MRIALLYDTITRIGEDTGPLTETAEAVLLALEKGNHDVFPLKAERDFLSKLDLIRPDLVFNIAAGIRHKGEQPLVAALLELSGIPYTGSSYATHTIATQKHLAKIVFQAMGLATPRFAVFSRIESGDAGRIGLSYPLMVKPAWEGSSVGIGCSNLVYNCEELHKVVLSILTIYKQPALVEEFLPGREFTVAILGTENPTVLPIEEIVTREPIYTHTAKVEDRVEYRWPHLDQETVSAITSLAKDAYQALGCRDYARVDIRMDASGKPQLLEINTLPGLAPGYSELPRIAQKAGIPYTALINRIVDMAAERYAIWPGSEEKPVVYLHGPGQCPIH